MVGEKRFLNGIGEGLKAKFPGVIEMTKEEIRHADNNYVREFFDANPVCAKKAGGATGGTAEDENIMKLNSSQWEYHIIGTQTITAPSLGTYGLNAVLDDNENDGVEFCLGIKSFNKGVFVVGTSPAFFTKMRFSIDDVSGVDVCLFGFRSVEAFDVDVTAYSDYVALDADTGTINIHTNQDDGSASETDTTETWGNGEIHEFGVYVSAAGVVTYTIDGVPPSTTAAYTCTDAVVLVPFFHTICAANPEAADISLIEFECGLQ